jgi:hypothetical protein
MDRQTEWLTFWFCQTWHSIVHRFLVGFFRSTWVVDHNAHIHPRIYTHLGNKHTHTNHFPVWEIDLHNRCVEDSWGVGGECPTIYMSFVYAYTHTYTVYVCNFAYTKDIYIISWVLCICALYVYVFIYESACTCISSCSHMALFVLVCICVYMHKYIHMSMHVFTNKEEMMNMCMCVCTWHKCNVHHAYIHVCMFISHAYSYSTTQQRDAAHAHYIWTKLLTVTMASLFHIQTCARVNAAYIQKQEADTQGSPNQQPWTSWGESGTAAQAAAF